MAYQRSDKAKQYLETNVYEEAKKRIEHTIKVTDDRIVGFSGGKDSLVLLNLVKEVYDDLGLEEKVKVFFLDEEFVPQSVIDFVTEIYQSDVYDFRYYAIPLESQRFVLNTNIKYTQWDRNRKWFREPPSFAIQDDVKGLSEFNLDSYITKDLKGKVAIFRGIRTDESMFRFLAIYSNKTNYPYLSNSKVSKRIINSQPIYDWSVEDIFLYFYKNNIKYCKTYDMQMWNDENLRVATPLLSENKSKFHKFKTYDENFYDRILEIFSDFELNSMYYQSMDRSIDLSKYEPTVKSLMKYIDDNVTANVGEVKKKFLGVLKSREKAIKNGKVYFGGFPYRYLFKKIHDGSYKKNITPTIQYHLEDFLFEGYTEEDFKKYRKEYVKYKW